MFVKQFRERKGFLENLRENNFDRFSKPDLMITTTLLKSMLQGAIKGIEEYEKTLDETHVDPQGKMADLVPEEKKSSKKTFDDLAKKDSKSESESKSESKSKSESESKSETKDPSTKINIDDLLGD